MPTYEFMTKDGRVVESYYHMSEAPRVGEKVEIDGARVERIMSGNVQFTVPAARQVKAYSLPVKHQMDPELAKSVKSWDEDGTPCFSGQRDIDRFLDASKRVSDTTDAPSYYSYGE